MRLRRPIATAAIASLALLAPPAASAERYAHPSQVCRVGINIAPRLIEAGESTLVFGRLRCPGAVGGRTVRLLARPAGTSSFRFARGTSTDASGFYEFVLRGIEYNSAFFVRSGGAVSATRALRVLAHVSLVGPPDGSQIFTGAASKVTFTGTVSPNDVGARVVLQRQNANTGEDWHRIGVGQVIAGGTYSITHTFVVPGDANIRVLVHSQRRNVASPSAVLTYEISQAQNPQFTINASADPITFGQMVTISGTAPGAAKAPVTLLSRTAGQPSFAPVAEAKADASGNYAFPAQAPVENTFYEVSGAGRTSAVLYEGVRDLLTAQVSSTSVQAGGTVTFSGVVAPDHTGHVIYLERQDHLGAEFHVVQVGVIAAGSTYSIAHMVFDPGLNVFRVKIPGGPENQGAVSQPFTVSVSRAPAELLRPEGPQNSTVPSEGER
jgi:phage protein U